MTARKSTVDPRRKVGKKPGSPKTGGRVAGTPNKITAALKDMILGALDDAGGQSYLAGCAKDPRTATAFLGLVGKVLPLQVTGAGPNGEHVFERIVREIVDPRDALPQPAQLLTQVNQNAQKSRV